MVPGVAVVDVRKLFANPYVDPALRTLRGTDPAVATVIETAPGFREAYRRLRGRVEKAIEAGAEVVYVGCTGGHHRSVYLAERLGRELGAVVVHRDIDKP